MRLIALRETFHLCLLLIKDQQQIHLLGKRGVRVKRGVKVSGIENLLAFFFSLTK
jgi:hypothetical protein